VVVAANDAAPTQWRIPMSRLTDTQLVILSSASRRNDCGVDLPSNVTDEAVRKAVEGRHLGYSGIRTRIIPLSSLPKTSNNIIQKGLAFGREQSGTVTVPGTTRASGSCPAGCMAEVGLRWWRQ
jgi:hypothetical protein